MIFDGHLHIGSKDLLPNRDKDPIFKKLIDNPGRKYQRVAMSNNILKAVALPYPVPEALTPQANAYVSQAYNQYKALFIPFHLISNTPEPKAIEISNIVGFKEHFAQGKYQDMGYFAQAYDLMEQKGLILVIHPHMSERIEKIRYLKNNFSKLKIILAHSGRKWPFTGDDIIDSIIPALKDYGELYFDTSTIRDSSVITSMVDQLGSQRIIFGSDFPYFDKAGEEIYDLEINTITRAAIKDEDKENILTHNFKRLFMDKSWVRRSCQQDKTGLLDLLDQVPSKEKKFLALDKKMAVIRNEIKNQRHIYILEDQAGILGFTRESGRANNGAIIEEIYIRPELRGKGFAGQLLDGIINQFTYLEAKTFRENTAIAALLKKYGFQVTRESAKGNILYWKKENGSN